MIIVRLALSIVLLVFVYRETGWATTTFAAFVTLGFEGFANIFKEQHAKLEMIKRVLKGEGP